MKEQELEYHCKRLESAFRAASTTHKARMRPGIEWMILSFREKRHCLPISLKRLERDLKKKSESDFFENMPI